MAKGLENSTDPGTGSVMPMRFLFLFFTIYHTIFGTEFWAPDYETAHRQAQESGKLIMIESMRPGCYYCRVMEERVFEDETAREAIAKRVIPLKIDISHESMPAGIEARVTPSFYFLDANGNLVKKLIGGWTKEDFLEILAGIGE
jgi:thioredoxin-related protein